SSAVGSACRSSTTCVRTPRAWAPVAKSSVSAALISCRTYSSSHGVCDTISTLAGSNKWYSRSGRVTVADWASVSPPDGSHPSRTANNHTANSASQNTGEACRVYARPQVIRSNSEPYQWAQTVPSTRPSSSAPANATATRSTVQPIRSASTCATGWRMLNETPRSPVNTSVNQSHQRSQNGWSNPKFSCIRWWDSAPAVNASVTRYCRTGSNGEAAPSANSTKLTTNRIGTRNVNRRVTSRPIPLSRHRFRLRCLRGTRGTVPAGPFSSAPPNVLPSTVPLTVWASSPRDSTRV